MSRHKRQTDNLIVAAVYDDVMVGTIRQCSTHKFEAFDLKDRRLGVFDTMIKASRAIPKLKHSNRKGNLK